MSHATCSLVELDSLHTAQGDLVLAARYVRWIRSTYATWLDSLEVHEVVLFETDEATRTASPVWHRVGSDNFLGELEWGRQGRVHLLQLFNCLRGTGGVRRGGPDARPGAMERRRAALPRCAARAPARGLSAPQGSPHRPLDPPLRAADCDAGRCQLLPVRHARGHAEIGGPKAPAPHGAGEAPTGPSASPAPRSLRERPSHPHRDVPPSHRATGPRWAPGIATHREWVA